MKKLSLAFFGTPDFSAAFLEKIFSDPELPIEVKQVFTQPDAKVGRTQTITKTPVREIAEQKGVNVHTDLNNAAALLKEIDLAFLFAYGKIIPSELLSAPKFGFWNLHPSLLPKYRGPSPMATSLLNGDVETGVTIIQLDEELDHGPVIAQQACYIFPVWRRDQLEKHLIDLGSELFKKVVLEYASDLSRVPHIEQNHADATYTQRMKKDDGYVPLEKLRITNYELRKNIFNKFRGYYPWPGLWTTVKIGASEKRLKITKIHWENDDMVIKKVQLEGKNEVDYEQFKKAYQVSLT
jgi:methionyl-tRNA formyltransferase